MSDKRHSFPKKLPKVIICYSISLRSYNALRERGVTVIIVEQKGLSWKTLGTFSISQPVSGK